MNDNLTNAEALSKKHHIRHIPIVRGNVNSGMLSYTDLPRFSFVHALNDDNEIVDAKVYNM